MILKFPFGLWTAKHVPYLDREPRTPLKDQTHLWTHDVNMTAENQETNREKLEEENGRESCKTSKPVTWFEVMMIIMIIYQPLQDHLPLAWARSCWHPQWSWCPPAQTEETGKDCSSNHCHPSSDASTNTNPQAKYIKQAKYMESR